AAEAPSGSAASPPELTTRQGMRSGAVWTDRQTLSRLRPRFFLAHPLSPVLRNCGLVQHVMLFHSDANFCTRATRGVSPGHHVWPDASARVYSSPTPISPPRRSLGGRTPALGERHPAGKSTPTPNCLAQCP